MVGCACRTEGPYERVCDYCSYVWEDSRCPHADYQDPCPECDVLPVGQLVDSAGDIEDRLGGVGIAH